MARKISINILSPSSIDKAIKELQAYEQSLNDKCEEFVRELAEIGIPVIDERMSAATFTIDSNGIQSGADSTHNTYIKIHSFGDYSEATLVTEGSELLFVEFGAGVYYNGSVGSSPHPKGGEFGYRIGYYGKGHGKQKVWGYYDDGGELVLTHGVNATMPVYSAWKEMYMKLDEIAREVFTSG